MGILPGSSQIPARTQKPFPRAPDRRGSCGLEISFRSRAGPGGAGATLENPKILDVTPQFPFPPFPRQNFPLSQLPQTPNPKPGGTFEFFQCEIYGKKKNSFFLKLEYLSPGGIKSCNAGSQDCIFCLFPPFFWGFWEFLGFFFPPSGTQEFPVWSFREFSSQFPFPARLVLLGLLHSLPGAPGMLLSPEGSRGVRDFMGFCSQFYNLGCSKMWESGNWVGRPHPALLNLGIR